MPDPILDATARRMTAAPPSADGSVPVWKWLPAIILALGVSLPVAAAPSMDDVLRSCVSDPESGICSEDFLRSMTGELQSRDIIGADEHLAKGTIDGKATIVVRSAAGVVRAVPVWPVTHSMNP